MFACWWSSTSLPKAWHKDPSGWWRRPVLRGWGWFRPTSTLQIVHCSFYPRNIWFWDGVHIGIVPRLRWFHLAPKQFTKTKAPKQFQRQLSRSMYQSSWGCRKSYGPEYRESVEYLIALARNDLYLTASLPNLPWHQRPGAEPGVGDPVNRLHPSVLSALAPAMPLRAVFGGNRRVWPGRDLPVWVMQLFNAKYYKLTRMV